MNLEHARIELAIITEALASDMSAEDRADVATYLDICKARVAVLES